jgi:ectoine hydroxylase-related dioxygenase (phytanoyl-CoA dioxygenase family)
VCQQLNACAYLDDVAPRSGGFTVYPGSHKLMFQAHRYESNWSPKPSYQDVMTKVVEEIEPYEIVAEKGAVIFWHGRTVHSSGIHIGSTIRWALFADFTRDRAVMNDEEHKQLGQFEWFKDTKLFREDSPVSTDMWRNWKVSPKLMGATSDESTD